METNRTPHWQAKQPLVAASFFFILGIVFQDHVQASWKPSLLTALGAAMAWLAISWRVLTPPWSIAPLIFLAGAFVTAGQLRALEGSSPNHLRQLVLRMPQRMTLRGVVRTDPAHRDVETPPRGVSRSMARDDPEKEGYKTATRSEFELEVSAVRFLSAWEPASGRVLVRARDSTGEIEYGLEIEAEGVLREPPPARNFGLFDYAAYLRRMGIHHVLQVDEPDAIRLLGVAAGGQWIFNARKKLAERLTLGIQADRLAAGIIRGMLLGYREDIPPDVNDAFRRTGTLHVFAISGSHISLIALSLLVLLRQIRVSQTWAFAVVLPLLVFYVVATGLRASAVRSLVMAAVVIAGWALRRPSALLNNLAASALMILAWDPLQLFDAGFQLSFVVVAALILVAPRLDDKIRGWIEPDPYIPRCCVPRWRLELIPPSRWLSALVAVCVAAWIGSLGLNLYYFNLFSLVALPANLLIVPLASASVGLGLVSLLAGAVWDQMAITFNATHALLVHAMVGISEKLASWRCGYLYAPQPPVGWVLAGYALALAIGLLWLKKRKARAVTLATVSATALLGTVMVAWNTKDVRMDVLDVGGGQSALITGPGFERVLIDAGSRSQGKMVVEPFLRSRGVNVIDLAVISHGDAGHYGGFLELLNDVPIRRLVVADARFRSAGYRRLLARLCQSEIPAVRWRAGDECLLRSGRLTALWPSGRLESGRADDLALVLQLRTPQAVCVFASDIGESAEAALGRQTNVSRTVLVQGIHSNEESLTAAWLQALKPSVIVLNSAEYPLRAYPSVELQERLRTSSARVYRTDHSGGVILRLAREGIQSAAFFSD
ncbi:MAG: DNA internalization-related competence protein ComEC/Rec2 [Verrucomicrobia bacterium]|nr:DNA internalization-related competence protein ComEC/Rec2 [Verrucomicrobiota bacterium]